MLIMNKTKALDTFPFFIPDRISNEPKWEGSMSDRIGIGSLVDFNITEELKGLGVVMGLASEAAPDVRFWIVLILRRDTEFLKQRPEKAIVMLESALKLSKDKRKVYITIS